MTASIHPHGNSASIMSRRQAGGFSASSWPRLAAAVVPVAPEAGRALAELAASQHRLALALEAAGMGLWEYDCRTHAIEFSDNWRDLFGHLHDPCLGAAQFDALVPGDEREGVRSARRQLLKGEVDRIALEHQVVAPSGESAWMLTEAQVTERSAGGRALKILGTCKDITARKKADVALRAALQAADQANRAKSEFLATMSHEIRTPLNGVVGLTELLTAAELPPMEADAVGMIASCARSLLGVVDNVLDFSRIEAGRLTLEPIPVDVRRLAHELGDVFGVRGSEKGVRFELSVQPDVPQWITADPVRLRQILLNLLGNALKFTAAGRFGLAVRVEGGREPALVFDVEDTGIGISPEDQQLLFTRFTQVDASNTRRYSGSGLGLAICRQLARLMEGDVAVASHAGQGSTFSLRLPLQGAAPAVATAPAAPRAQARRDASLLLVEDNPVNRLVAQRLLQMLGYQNIATANDGREAVAACAQRQFDLVLMDCQMPEMDGWEATRHLRAAGHRMPIIALTASAVAGDRERCLSVGMNDYLTKPIESALMAEKIDRWLEEQAPAAQEAPGEPAFDAGVIAERFFGDESVFRECRTLFVDGSAAPLARLRAISVDGDRKEVLRIAHTLKGSAACVGAGEMAAWCARIEQACADDAAPQPEWALNADDAFRRFVAATA